MKLSIIICVYNTKKYLFEECLRSITESTLFKNPKDPEPEIIVIDDGSDTDYSDLIERYGIRYSKTKNQGIFKARALGVRLAVGKYVAFIDSDDTVSFNYHAPMVKKAEKSGADIVINDWAYHTKTSRYYSDADSTVTTESMRLFGNEIIKAFLSQEGREHSYYVLWNKLYRKEVLENAIGEAEKSTAGEEKYSYSEDVLINFYAFLNAKLVVNVHTGYYFYRYHQNQSVNTKSREMLKNQIRLMSLTLDKMEGVITHRSDAQALIKHVIEWRKFISRAHFTHAKSMGLKSLYPYIKERYGVKKLKRSTYNDEICGMRCVPLPDNFKDIDASLFTAWKNGVIAVPPSHTLKYVLRTNNYFLSAGIFRVSYSLTVPEPIIPISKRLRHAPLVMRIARVLFPKGSKMRLFLKRHI